MAGRPARKSFTERRELALSDFREQVIEAQGQLSSLVLVADGGEKFEIPHPMMLSDDAQKRVETVQAYRDLDRDENDEIKVPLKIDGELADPLVIRFARALLGEEEHARFIAAGGHSHDVELAWLKLSGEQKELMEADPK